MKNAQEILEHNLANPNTRYSKAEHKSTNPSAEDMRLWNYFLKKSEQYTKEEHKETKPDSEEMWQWNYYLPKAEQYTEIE